jgi:hypothetical protein
MKKVHLLVFVIFGFFLIPTGAFACGSHSGKSCCNKEMATNSNKMDCCKNNNHSKNKSQDGCKGKCGHSNCVTTSYQFNSVFFEIKFNNNNFDFSEEKQNFHNAETNISSGFNSLWLIPKIS